MDSIFEDAEHKSGMSGLSNTIKLAVIAGTLGATGIVSYMCRDGGTIDKALKKASGPNDSVDGAQPGGWPNTSGGGHYMDWHAHHKREDFAGWSSEHAAGAAAPQTPITSHTQTPHASHPHTQTPHQAGHGQHSPAWHEGFKQGFKVCESQNRVGPFAGASTPALPTPTSFPSPDAQQGYQHGVAACKKHYGVTS